VHPASVAGVLILLQFIASFVYLNERL